MSKDTQLPQVSPELAAWTVAPRILSEEDKLSAKLADLSETDASLLSKQELEEAAETGWLIAYFNRLNLGS